MQQVVAVVGGTGAEGSGLALRFAKAGLRVLIGSRNLDRAQAAAKEIAAQAGAGEVTGHTNSDAVSKAAIVILTVPLSAQVETLKSIRANFAIGRNPCGCHRAARNCHRRPCIPHADVCGMDRPRSKPRDLRPRASPVVATFHLLGAEALKDLDHPVDCDALICGDNADAKATVSELAETIPGVRAIDAGPLENARLSRKLRGAAHRFESANIR